MPTLYITSRSGKTDAVEGESGQRLMNVLRERGDVEALCGGDCACATCHVHIGAPWWPAVGEPGETESALLEYSMEKQPTSRLSCQVSLSDAMDGMTLTVAAAEG